MNGITDAYLDYWIEAMQDDQRPDDDDGPQECQVCRGDGWQYIEYDDLGAFGLAWEWRRCAACNGTGMV